VRPARARDAGRRAVTAMTAGVRGLREICELARMCSCGHCRAKPGPACAHRPDGAAGVHVARLARAFRRRLVSGTELVAALQSALALMISSRSPHRSRAER
jgi:hypothetical protein